jgi:glyoxylase-like metal-dependent hydrolase (beta-lactamase superfamily II)
LSEHLFVYPGPINVGIIRDGDQALLIDCGDGRVAEAFGMLGIQSVGQLLFTHHHRDQACGAERFASAGAKVAVPAAEKASFDDVGSYWNDPKYRWDVYNFHPHRLMLTEPVRVGRTVDDGQELAWGQAKIRAIATPGHTDGSLSYLVEVDGRRVVFSGDVIYGEGQIWDLYSMQKGLQWPGGSTSDYHGFLGSRGELVASLDRIRQTQPALLVPAHGRLLHDPSKAIEALVGRLAECHDKYVAISALRHYFPKAFAEYEGCTDHMPLRPGQKPPDCLRQHGTSWMLISKSGAAFVMDCGSPKVIEKIQEYRSKGEIRDVEGLWVTHYHNDHTAAIPDFQKTFDCPCITDESVAGVIARPMDWHLPCVMSTPVRVDRAARHGESWQWHEFKLTAYHLPGQTLYHSGLLAESGDLRMLFVGDSFTPGGIDDYCAYNRNWLGRGVGFDQCIALIQELRPTHIFNCHVSDAFDFTPEQCQFMRDNLAQRERLFGQLFPWDHANYGMDASWARAMPYEQQAQRGEELRLRVVVTNHSEKAQQAQCRAIPPRRWMLEPTDWTSGEIAPKTEGSLGIVLRIASDAEPGRYVLPIDLRYGPWDLPQFTEAVVVVG